MRRLLATTGWLDSKPNHCCAVPSQGLGDHLGAVRELNRGISATDKEVQRIEMRFLRGESYLLSLLAGMRSAACITTRSHHIEMHVRRGCSAANSRRPRFAALARSGLLASACLPACTAAAFPAQRRSSVYSPPQRRLLPCCWPTPPKR